MNRAGKILAYAAALALMALAVRGVQRLVMLPAVYESIHQIGHRVGGVLPQGYNERSRLGSNLSVTLEQPPEIPRVIRGQHPENTEPTTNAQAGVDPRVGMILGVVYLAAMSLVGLTSRWHDQQERLRRTRWDTVLVSLTMGCGACVLGAMMLSVMRVFWTGVDKAFYARSLVQLPGSKSIRVRGDLLLAMSYTELVMMMIAMVMTIIPVLILIDSRLLRRAGCADRGERHKHRSLLTRITASRLLAGRFSERSLRGLAALCYVATTLLLWSAPWSTTMARALWV